MEKLNQKQVGVIERLTGTEGLDYEIARKISIETFGDMTKALSAASDYKYHESRKNKE
ncbi:hypothetical protein D3C73_1326350 [compost metagenome]